ncbi:MAG: hypothetical protein RLP44_15070 [Aggregatilineales bacterium]
MFVIVQEIKIQWTKASRGGEGASRRNTVPDALTLAKLPQTLPPLPLVHQRTVYAEAADFQPSVTQTEIHDLMLNRHVFIGCVRIISQTAQLQLTYQPGISCAGAPKRTFTRKEFVLKPDTWARIGYNGRFGWASGWSYHKTVFNIAYISATGGDIFANEPAHTFSDFADLW